MTASVDQGCAVRVKPRTSLLRNGSLSFVFVSVALFGSLYFLAIPLGTWPAIVAIHILMTVAFCVAWVRYRMTYVGVRLGQLEYQGFLRPQWAVAIEKVESVTIVRTYRPNSPDTSAQFLARDAAGTKILRMRGLFWHENDMRLIADALDRDLDIRPDPVTTKDFLAEYPGSAFWFEGRPALTVAGTVGLLAIAFCTVLGLMMLTGITVGRG